MLDAGSLFELFSKLDGKNLARCACVCVSWRSVACSEALWQRLCLAMEPSELFRDDLMADELGDSYRQYFAWRYPRICRRLNMLCILDNSGSGQTRLALAEVVQQQGAGACTARYTARNVSVITPPGSYIGGTVTKPTWSPKGGLLAYSALHPARMSIVVVDCRGGPVGEVELDDPSTPAFYLHWAPCGTRLLLLSAFPSGPVALKSWDVGRALLGGEAAGRGRARKPVLLGTARPLFLTCSPSSTRVLWHGNMRDYALVDCATTVDEDGSEHDRVFANTLAGGGRAPQWVEDAQGRQWLLLCVVLGGVEDRREQGLAGGEGEEAEGELVLLPVDGLEEAYEMGGSVLSVHLVRSLATRVCQLTDVGALSYAANRDGSIVAWAEACQVSVRFMGAGERRFRLELPGRHVRAAVLAMQWAPDGCKLLMLAVDGNDWFWAVWHAPSAPPPDDVADPAALGLLGCLMLCQLHQPSAAFQSEYLPFFDQFAQSMRLWSPASDAFCYAALDASPRPSLRDIGRESSYVYVQPVLSVLDLQAWAASEAATSSSAGSSSGGGGSRPSRRSRAARFRGELGEGPWMAAYDAPPPSRIMPGCLVSWSFM